MSFALFLGAICLINSIAILVYVISSFGSGMLFHMGWQFCARISDGNVCSGTISTGSVLITIAAFFLLPIQLTTLLDHVDWKLGLNLSICQQIGVFTGMYVSFAVQSDWLARGLGISMFMVAIQKTLAEIKSLEAGIVVQAIEKYEFKGMGNYAVVWAVGISSGFFGGLYAAGGPPLMWFVATTNLEKNVCRGTVSFLYLIENIGRIIFLAIFVPQDEVLSMKLSSFAAVCVGLTATSLGGLVAGNTVAAGIDQQSFRYLILAMLAFGSVLLASTGCSAVETALILIAAGLVYCTMYFYFARRMELKEGGRHPPPSLRSGVGGGNDQVVISTSFELVKTRTSSNHAAVKYTAINTCSSSCSEDLEDSAAVADVET